MITIANYRKQLDRTATSLSNHVGRGATLNAARSQQLVDRYEELRMLAMFDQEYRTEFYAFCESRGWDRSHDAYDFFA